MNIRKLYGIFIVLFVAVNCLWAVEIINGREYDSLEGHWYQIENDSLRWEVVDTMITVRFGDSASEEQIDSINQMYKTTSIRINPVTGFRDLKFKNQDPVELIRNYESENIVDIAEVCLYGEYLIIPNDRRFPEQSYLEQPSDCDIDVTNAWDIEYGNESVIVGILDSGTEWYHEDLDSNIWVNIGYWGPPECEDLDEDRIVGDYADDENALDDDYNGFVDDLIGWDFAESDNDPDDSYGHGTFVAGVVGAMTNTDHPSGNTIAGVAGGWYDDNKGVKLMLVGMGHTYFVVSGTLDDAIIYAAMNDADIITLAITIGWTYDMIHAFEAAYKTYGCFIDCASGNDAMLWEGIAYPACGEYICGVGATQNTDLRANFSQYGCSLDIVAPGVNILSTFLHDSYLCTLGTSAAAPQVAGVAALLLSHHSDLTNDDLNFIIEATADRARPDSNEYNDTEGWYIEMGHGRLNAQWAMKSITPYTWPDFSFTHHMENFSSNEPTHAYSDDCGNIWDTAKRRPMEPHRLVGTDHFEHRLPEQSYSYDDTEVVYYYPNLPYILEDDYEFLPSFLCSTGADEFSPHFIITLYKPEAGTIFEDVYFNDQYDRSLICLSGGRPRTHYVYPRRSFWSSDRDSMKVGFKTSMPSPGAAYVSQIIVDYYPVSVIHEGCPWLKLQYDTTFQFVNNLLPRSDFPDGCADMPFDIVPLLREPEAEGYTYIMRIEEMGDWTDSIDNVKLVAIDHSIDSFTAVDYYGNFYVFDPLTSIAPVRAYAYNCGDIESLVCTDNAVYYESEEPGWLVLVFPPYDTIIDGEGLLAGDAIMKASVPELKVEVFYDDQWTEVGYFPARGYMIKECVSFPADSGDSIFIKLSWDEHYKLDCAWININPTPVYIPINFPLTNAMHSISGDVRGLLQAVDSIYATMQPDEFIDLRFDTLTAPEPGMIRDYYFVIYGHWVEGGRGGGSGGTGTIIPVPDPDTLEEDQEEPEPPEEEHDYGKRTAEIDMIPKVTSLGEPKPNPFNATIDIPFDVSEEQIVHIAIYDISGKLIDVLADKEYEVGRHHLVWDGSSMNSGTYFVKMTAGDYTNTKQIVLIK